jgi:hypothetical protein
LDILRSNF